MGFSGWADEFQKPAQQQALDVARKHTDNIYNDESILTITLLLLLFSCGQKTNQSDKDTIKEGNKSITISTDTAKLSKIIDIATYKPTKAMFQYIFIDNSGQNERLTVPGPSDNYFQAILHFDSTTFRQLQTKYLLSSYVTPNYDKRDFNFIWLDTTTVRELMQSDTNYHGHPDLFLGLGTKGRLWFLKNKVLLTKTSD